ncbi:MAG: pyridoxamine 5'-phosphate oxidase family protein [Deltaproteobacteria bacterium]|nr:pyridoxamine 5'-phosphate oxidase family protein [Deltaproteobacteria bacterium]MBW1848906.1 pyridoxamine 5'-phosphate oxidase family protein [Deltaproteobacteria bacterium]MBW1983233.1 pyridoxamine 5'-phosphate oxidase family protein [Deltaproteobacteria bacterium]MBW2181531.1 pyridoxamine 5'-phosphate oxidase family protein [Deltaproteobacteria bacterium]MBW2364513.1 pyridoxamine 5'-phosphate oxidase family protein [Deltaproteobacteria bacterium]
MRRKDKEISDPEMIQWIIRRSTVCRLAMVEGSKPYVVPLCFGFEDNCLYFHCSEKGKKIDILKANNNVCFEFDIDQEVIPSDKACSFGMKYFSVIGFGKASFIEDNKEKQKALDIIMHQYSEKSWNYSDDFITHILVIKVEIDSIAGKQSGVD